MSQNPYSAPVTGNSQRPQGQTPVGYPPPNHAYPPSSQQAMYGQPRSSSHHQQPLPMNGYPAYGQPQSRGPPVQGQKPAHQQGYPRQRYAPPPQGRHQHNQHYAGPAYPNQSPQAPRHYPPNAGGPPPQKMAFPQPQRPPMQQRMPTAPVHSSQPPYPRADLADAMNGMHISNDPQNQPPTQQRRAPPPQNHYNYPSERSYSSASYKSQGSDGSGSGYASGQNRPRPGPAYPSQGIPGPRSSNSPPPMHASTGAIPSQGAPSSNYGAYSQYGKPPQHEYNAYSAPDYQAVGQSTEYPQDYVDYEEPSPYNAEPADDPNSYSAAAAYQREVEADIAPYGGRRSSDHEPSTQQTYQQNPPPPMRQYNTSTSDPLHEASEKPQELTVADLEAARNKMKKSNDPSIQLDFAKKLVEAAKTLTNQYSDPSTPLKNVITGVDAKTERKNREQWTLQAHKLVKKLAAIPYPPAIFYLASSYSSGGLNLEVDYERALEYYLKAAKLQVAEGAYRAAVCYEIGAGTKGGKRDVQTALAWYRRAAQLGDVSAMYKLGMINLNGLLGQPRSFAEAVTWLERAAEKADSETPHAVHELGLLYENADNLDISAINAAGTAAVITKNETKALQLYTKAARLGYPPSQFRLGCAYEYGTLECEIDAKRSIAWYSRAAEKGEADSELALSGWYLTGADGILAQSDTEAYLWARRAAEKGLAKAEYALGYFTEVGIGVKSDIEEAKKWYFKAAAQKHPKAIQRLQELRNTQ